LIEQQPQITHDLCARGALISNLTINPLHFAGLSRLLRNFFFP
jgi:hypothetical protein